MIPATPKRAALAMPVSRAAPAELDAPEARAVAGLLVGVATPLVNGTFEADVAPANAASVEAVFGVWVAFIGFKTLSMTWTTPLATMTFGTI